jgi:hypothetical protein
MRGRLLIVFSIGSRPAQRRAFELLAAVARGENALAGGHVKGNSMSAVDNQAYTPGRFLMAVWDTGSRSLNGASRSRFPFWRVLGANR